MILWAGGWSLLLLGLFYAVIDVLGFRAWAYFFVVIGANAIVAYMCQKLFNVWGISQTWFGGLTAHFGRAADFWLAFGAAALTWVGLWVLYRKRIFLRV